ncbi:hypothetical protein QBC41DRAFT_215658 [Cercophora samala]|uniref:Uncharacterized protein n=1 Tax=Cercophora samala TaxID=330535 RepID=A0AA40DDZ8_9PEZI|nr:hypothetical protein QBC41DRAFT_215658 [Cercophora samala]
MSHNTSRMPGVFPGGNEEYARLNKQLVDTQQELGVKRAELASAMEMIGKQGGHIGDLNYKLNLVTRRAEKAEAALREVSAHHHEALEALDYTRHAQAITEAKLREAEMARQELEVNLHRLSELYYPMEAKFKETRRVLSATEAQLKDALTARDEARGSLHMSQKVWDCERVKLESKYNDSQTQLHTVQGRLVTAEDRLKEALRLNDEAARSLADKTAYMYEASKYKEAYGVAKQDLDFFKLRLANTEDKLGEMQKERDLARVDADLRDRLSGLHHDTRRRVGFSPHVEVTDMGHERIPRPVTPSRTRTCSRRSSMSYSYSGPASMHLN